MLILAAVVCLTWLLAIGIVRPVRHVARAVSQFGRGDLSMRVRVTRNDEIGDLGHAFNDMAERLETLLTAERRLLQDISHELRSPLARLNIAIELARHAEDRDAAALRLQREADRLTSLVGSLIEVTRMEGDPTAVKFEPLSAGAIVDEVVKGCTVEADARQCRIVVRNEITRGLMAIPSCCVVRSRTCFATPFATLRRQPTSASRRSTARRASPSPCATVGRVFLKPTSHA